VKRSSRLLILAISSGFLPWLGGISVHAGANKKAGTAVVNTNPQWSADPEHGWIRTEGRQKAHEKRQSTKQLKNNSGKHKSQSAQEK
jgi:hypothetical protein